MIMTTEENQELPQDWQLGKSRSESALSLLESGQYADVKFCCKDQDKSDNADRVAAHRLILASRSPVFESMFYGQLAESGSDIELPDIKKTPFLLFLRYLYSDDTDLLEEHALDVMYISHKYRVSTCLELCSGFLQVILRPDNAAIILEHALLFNNEALRNAACEHIDDNAQEVMESDGFIEISQATLEHILKGNLFYAPEISIINAADKWASNKLAIEGKTPVSANKRIMLGNAFYYLRLPTMPLQDFMEIQLKYASLTYEELINASKYIIEKKFFGHELCNSTEERIPRKTTYSLCMSNFSSEEDERQTSSTNCEIKLTLICHKTTELEEVVLCKNTVPDATASYRIPAVVDDFTYDTTSKQTRYFHFDSPKDKTATASCKISDCENDLILDTTLYLKPNLKFNPPILMTASGCPYHLVITIPKDSANNQVKKETFDKIVPLSKRQTRRDACNQLLYKSKSREEVTVAEVVEKERIYRSTQTLTQEPSLFSHSIDIQANQLAFSFIAGIKYKNFSTRDRRQLFTGCRNLPVWPMKTDLYSISDARCLELD